MFRLRRYRLFLIVAALTTLTVYQLTRGRDWEVPDFEGLAKHGLKSAAFTSIPVALNPLATPSPILNPEIPTTLSATLSTSTVAWPTRLSHEVPQKPQTLAEQAATSSLLNSPTILSSLPTLAASPTIAYEDRLTETKQTVEEFEQNGQGRLNMAPWPSDQPRASWEPQKEHFPVASEALKVLPTGNAASLPRIQYDFPSESEIGKADRLRKLETIKESFRHAWKGYTAWALPHDELKPYTKGFSDPFNGWGATLVDSLDSLWIMGLADEFEAAVGNVSKIDFKTSARKDIPLFETVIRYLGGLISAYDLSSPKYPVLLDKAVELAEILMGAFDTPNRMPVTFYYWAPSYASQPHRANVHVVLAELGSLSVEFTRLAQITKEARYYDAVARITDALELYQMKTTLPGLWPTKLDASGCKKPDDASLTVAQSPLNDPGDLTWVPVANDAPMEAVDPVQASHASQDNSGESKSAQSLGKRQADDAAFTANQNIPGLNNTSKPPTPEKDTKLAAPAKIYGTTAEDVDCESQGLSEEPHSSWHHFTIGGMADSTYEYLTKEYILLGGEVDQYRTMYRNAMVPIREKLLYRPMTKQGRDILFVAKADLPKGNSSELKLTYEGSHLGCFAGGMFALGSKVFGIKDDMEIARKLTDGCVWAYESTTTGIMPEEFRLAPCDSLQKCSWNQTKYYDLLDPDQKRRMQATEQWNENQRTLYEQAAVEAQKASAHVETTAKETNDEEDDTSAAEDSPRGREMVQKRQLEYADSAKLDGAPTNEEGRVPTKTTSVEAEKPAAPAVVLPVFTPQLAVSHEEFVEARIQEERLPSGFTQIRGHEYKLRPEAIESVFIMYRITGDEYWREMGWKMFRAIEAATRTLEAHSAISDVTSQIPFFTDSMESFWLAETLKYFYLLFSDPSLISLDDYVLNTEAHPFRIPR